MILIRAGLFHILKCLGAGALTMGVLACLLLSYAYISGDHVDREDMHQAAGKIAAYVRIIPHAEASAANDRHPASENF